MNIRMSPEAGVNYFADHILSTPALDEVGNNLPEK
jgi:hypothetical protein